MKKSQLMTKNKREVGAKDEIMKWLEVEKGVEKKEKWSQLKRGSYRGNRANKKGEGSDEESKRKEDREIWIEN